MDEADRRFLREYVAYLTADGFGVGAITTRMERLEFEQIVTGKTIAEVIGDARNEGSGRGEPQAL